MKLFFKLFCEPTVLRIISSMDNYMLSQIENNLVKLTYVSTLGIEIANPNIISNMNKVYKLLKFGCFLTNQDYANYGFVITEKRNPLTDKRKCYLIVTPKETCGFNRIIKYNELRKYGIMLDGNININGNPIYAGMTIDPIKRFYDYTQLIKKCFDNHGYQQQKGDNINRPHSTHIFHGLDLVMNGCDIKLYELFGGQEFPIIIAEYLEAAIVHYLHKDYEQYGGYFGNQENTLTAGGCAIRKIMNNPYLINKIILEEYKDIISDVVEIDITDKLENLREYIYSNPYKRHIYKTVNTINTSVNFNIYTPVAKNKKKSKSKQLV